MSLFKHDFSSSQGCCRLFMFGSTWGPGEGIIHELSCWPVPISILTGQPALHERRSASVAGNFFKDLHEQIRELSLTAGRPGFSPQSHPVLAAGLWTNHLVSLSLTFFFGKIVHISGSHGVATGPPAGLREMQSLSPIRPPEVSESAF